MLSFQVYIDAASRHQRGMARFGVLRRPVMDWLIHNAIADMYGPTFLLVYGAIALVVIVVAFGLVRSCDKTGLRPPPPVPGIFNPYEIAYLRGGKNEVIRTV